MQEYNIVMVYSPQADAILMCKRTKQPYLGLYNLVGGKIEPGEDGLASAYRELWEETGISDKDISLIHIMDSDYPLDPCKIRVYAGRLRHPVALREEAHPLHWLTIADYNFFDMKIFAGEGNIGHMMEQVKLYEDAVLWNPKTQP